MGRTTDAFGTKAVESLALVAIDLLCYPPAQIETYTTRVTADDIRRGREIMERAGIDWRALKEAQ